ncbi:MAG: PD-(D/E)XK nuclease family protein [Parcubacteria group bacterium]|nr:PD-(D/E)XK nuclease family protein [Parcubacteria group bacterium]
MSQYYNAKRKSGFYTPGSNEPFKLSRSKIDLFIECPRCFYVDRRLGVGRPPGFPFNLNSAVDALLKKEFDTHRKRSEPHPLMSTYNIDAVPMAHDNIEIWRDVFKGIAYYHKPTNFHVYGAIDDVWVNPKGELHIVDYKATSKDAEVTLDAEWQMGYKRQMEIYQWLFRQNDFKVSKTGYFVYANAGRDKAAFDGVLEFKVTIIPYIGSSDWVDRTLKDAKETLDADAIPDASPECDYCAYRNAAVEVIRGANAKKEIAKPTATAVSTRKKKEKNTLF